MTVHRLDLAYDGTGFRGWARNQGVRTVQGEVEAALGSVLGVPVALSVAGRTDAGVHARHQVASFHHDRPLDAPAVIRSLRTILGPEISILDLAPAADGFDARFSARRRTYRYFIDESPAHDPRLARWVWHRGDLLDLEALGRAAAAFVGEHDFASLCRSAEGSGTERTVEAAAWAREPVDRPPPSAGSDAPGLLVFTVTARAFCHQMVRSMVALCVDVGRGRLDPGAVPGILQARDRNAARGAAPPHGLVLWEVGY